MVHTADGQSWHLQTQLAADYQYSIFWQTAFPDASNGWITNTLSDVLHTTDGGATWNVQSSGISSLRDWKSIAALDATHVWLGDFGTHVLRTVDGGGTWTESDAGLYDMGGMKSLSFPTPTDGWGIDGFSIVHTGDGGATWAQQFTHIEGGIYWVLHSLCFPDVQHGWAVGYDSNYAGLILHTTDGGTSWVRQDCGGTVDGLNAVSFTDSLHGWVVGQGGVILQTIDGGATWQREASGTTNYLTSIDMVDSMHGWAVGGAGTILRYTVSQTRQFDVKRDGWRFANGNDLKTSDDLAVWKKMFGSGKTSLAAYAKMVKADKAKGYPGVFADGVCYGMAASTGSYFMHFRALSAAGIKGITYPWSWGTWGPCIPHLTSFFNGTLSKGTAPRLRTEIELFYLTQYADDVARATAPNELSHSNAKLGRGWRGSYRRALASWVSDLSHALQTGTQIVKFGDAEDGYHAVLAYSLTASGSGRYAIHIYDSNFPGDSSRSIAVDTAKGVWSYSSRFWEGKLDFWHPMFTSKRPGDEISFVSPSLPADDVAQASNGPLRLAVAHVDYPLQ